MKRRQCSLTSALVSTPPSAPPASARTVYLYSSAPPRSERPPQAWTPRSLHELVASPSPPRSCRCWSRATSVTRTPCWMWGLLKDGLSSRLGRARCLCRRWAGWRSSSCAQGTGDGARGWRRGCSQALMSWLRCLYSQYQGMRWLEFIDKHQPMRGQQKGRRM